MAKKKDDAFDQAYSRGAKVKRFFTIIVFILTVITCIQLFFIHDSKQFNRQVFSLIQYIAFFLILNSPKLLKKFIEFNNQDILFAYSTILINNSTTLK